MTRRRFTERQVIAALIHQGVPVVCYRTGERITLENVMRLEREHLHDLALGGSDTPDNCRYSLKEAHAIATNGTKATTAGSSKHRIAKAKRMERERLSEHSGQDEATPRAKARAIPSRPWPESKKQWPSRPFPKRATP